MVVVGNLFVRGFMAVLPLIILVFFWLYGVHQDLHSFPTRRSSDLWQCPKKRRNTYRRYRLWRHPKPAGGRQPVHPRSEEHTSELQSRRDLVCRLLLEKKKNYVLIGLSISCSISGVAMPQLFVVYHK